MSTVKYSAIAQNTYRFINDVTVSGIGNIEEGANPKIGDFKIIVANNTADATVKYVKMRHSSSTSNTGSFGPSLYKTWYTASNYEEIAMYNALTKLSFLKLFVAPVYQCEVDGKKYFGYKTSSFLLETLYFDATAKTNQFSVSYSETAFPNCKANIVKYNSVTKQIIAQTLDMEKVVFSASTYDYDNGSSTNYHYAIPILSVFYVPKVTDDLILSLTFEYPKYDVTLSGTGLQYSLDNGITFTDVTDGLELNQIEHVVFKNTGETDVTISTSDGTVLETIPAGAKYVAVPTENTTWVIA